MMDPERMPGILSGRMMSRKTPRFLDPQILADSIRLSRIFWIDPIRSRVIMGI